MAEHYKFENFNNINFPVYSSAQKGSGVLAIPHFHKGAECIKILKSFAEVNIHTYKFEAQKGDIIFIPPYSVHSVIGKNEDTEIQGIVFELSLISRDIHGLSAEKILNKDTINSFVLSSENELYCDINKYFSQAIDVYSKNSITYELEMLSALYKIFALLISNYFHGDDKYENYDKLQPVIDYIENNYQQKIQLSDLSSIINVCNDHLIRLFKAVTNKSPIKYINDFRLQEVLKLLINTDMSVTDIAYRVGFSDVNYMIRVFKAGFNMTPSQYRKKSK